MCVEPKINNQKYNKINWVFAMRGYNNTTKMMWKIQLYRNQQKKVGKQSNSFDFFFV